MEIILINVNFSVNVEIHGTGFAFSVDLNPPGH